MVLSLDDQIESFFTDPEIGPALGIRGVASSITGRSVISASLFPPNTYGNNHFVNKGNIVLPGRTGTDRTKALGTLNGSTMTVLDTNGYAGTYTNEPVEIYFGRPGPQGITRERLEEAVRLGLGDCYFATTEPLSMWQDGAMSETGVGAFVASGPDADITMDKSAAAAQNRTGYLSLLVSYIANSRYVYSATGKTCQPGDQFWVAALPIIVSGASATFEVWDYTGDTWVRQIASITATGVGAWHVGKQITAPNNCRKLNFRLIAPNGAVVAWDALPAHDLAATTIGEGEGFPTWATKNWMVKSVGLASYTNRGTNYVEAQNTRRVENLARNRNFTTAHRGAESAPGALIMLGMTRLPAQDVMITGQRRYTSRVPFVDVNETVNVEEQLLDAASKVYVFDILEQRDRLGPNGLWRQRQAENRAYVASYREAEEETEPYTNRVTTRRHMAV